MTWCLKYIGNRFFLAGSDYVFPRTANEIIKNFLLFFNERLWGKNMFL